MNTIFLAAASIELLVENPQRGPHGDHGMRIYHFDRFPYSVIHDEDPNNGPQILAVAHQSREPGYWSTRSKRAEAMR